MAFEGAGWGHLKMLVLSGAPGIGALTSPLFSQVVSQLPVSPESGETLFLAEQPPLPPVLTNGTGTSPGTAVPTAKPAPTLIKVQDSSPWCSFLRQCAGLTPALFSWRQGQSLS